MSAAPRAALLDAVAIIVCTLAWGTTWYAITLQFGVVDPIVSIVYRFALAAILLFAWCALRREAVALTRAQHLAALGIGLFTFAIDYAFVYWAEERVASAVVAVIFAALAFTNLAIFRLWFGERPAPAAWIAAGLGVAGVALLSWGEIANAQMSERALVGVALALGGVFFAAIGNVCARNGELAGAPVAPLTGWAMGYGAALLALFAVVTGRQWAFELSARYVLSLLHLSVVGSVIAFVLYYGLARRRGYGAASYIAALTPPVAMLVSSMFENKVWSVLALSGVALVLAGQWLLLRTRRA
ncbi:MAG: DMT family transporter [Hyphomonadaceae bacterium]